MGRKSRTRTRSSVYLLSLRECDGGDNLLNLVDGGGAREEGLAQQHLCQDTAKGPHVHTWHGRGNKGYRIQPRDHMSTPHMGEVIQGIGYRVQVIQGSGDIGFRVQDTAKGPHIHSWHVRHVTA